MGYYRSLFVVKDSNVSLRGFIDPYASLWVIMVFFRSTYALIDSNLSIWVFIGFFYVRMGPYGSL